MMDSGLPLALAIVFGAIFFGIVWTIMRSNPEDLKVKEKMGVKKK